MKSMTVGVVLSVVAACATSGVYGAQEPPGVAGVDVVVKQMPSKHDVTNAWGIFALDPLPAGSYTLSFKARPAHKSGGSTSDKVIVGTSYSLKIEGTKRPVNRSGLTSNKLVDGVDVAVEVESGAKVRGQVLSGSSKKWVWISPVVGSNLPGHWAEEGSNEAARHNVRVQTSREWQDANR
jgi:hypothetical protein